MNDNLNNRDSFESISDGMNTADMCQQCLCMLCNRGPDKYKTCDICSNCRGAVSICPIHEYEHA